MKLTLLYFQALRAKTGVGEETLDLADNATVADAVAAVMARHPKAEGLRPSLLAAVNEEWAPQGQRLREGDTLALMPPASGG